LKRLLRIELTIDNTRLKRIAVKKPSTENPATNLSTSRIISALITREKSPRVRTVMGSVNNTKIGFINVLTNPKANAVISALYKSATNTLGIIFAVANTANALITRDNRSCIRIIV